MKECMKRLENNNKVNTDVLVPTIRNGTSPETEHYTVRSMCNYSRRCPPSLPYLSFAFFSLLFCSFSIFFIA